MTRNKRTRAEVMGILGRASAYLRPYTRDLVITFCLIIVVSLCSIAYPPIVGKVIDRATHAGTWSSIEGLLLLYGILLLIRPTALLRSIAAR